jgi:anhydro-N-acetylmuramic acid kinase
MRYLGLMSGTSADGIDVAEIIVNKNGAITFGKTHYQKYSLDFYLELNRCKTLLDYHRLENKLTDLNVKAVKSFLKKHKVTGKQFNAIGYHGQTAIHRPEQGITVQLGNTARLRVKTQIPVVGDFRQADVAAGGQGAPLLPIFLEKLGNSLYLNIGGIANLTFNESAKSLRGLDIGPGCCSVNQYLKSRGIADYDKDGKIAFSGKINETIQELWLASNIMITDLKPGSLDVGDFQYPEIENLTTADAVTNLSEFTARLIVAAVNLVKNKRKQVYVYGGGRKNKYLFSRLNELSGDRFKKIDELGIDGDFVESYAFAYFSYLAEHKKFKIPASLTGANNPTLSGTIHY